MADFRAELQALVNAYDKHGGKWPQEDEIALCNAVQRARAALSTQPPDDGEVGELVTWLRAIGSCQTARIAQEQLTRAADLLDRLAPPHPIPVSERSDDRDPVCVAAWPDCVDGGYDPLCCRFPKSCSCDIIVNALPLPSGEVEA